MKLTHSLCWLAGTAALVSALPAQEITLAAQDLRLIELSPDQRQWMSESEIDQLIQNDVSFMDITDFQDLGVDSVSLLSDVPDLPRGPRMPNKVVPILKNLDTTRMREFLTKFSSFHNRYYDSKYGKESAQFLFETVQQVAQASPLNVTVTKFEHSWKQFSVIARFEPCASDSEWTVIVGAHQDSINGMNRMEGRAPGADDDGSGTTTILESFRALAATADFCPYHAVEFHWYSAEEVGLWGSQAVASAYKKAGRKIIAMLQNDMTGYVDDRSRAAGKPHFGLLRDFTDNSLSEFVKSLIGKYANMEVYDTRCGYGCSDHASWTKAGYRAASPAEGLFSEINHSIHTARDTMELLDFDHMLEFSKLSVSFAVELAFSETSDK